MWKETELRGLCGHFPHSGLCQGCDSKSSTIPTVLEVLQEKEALVFSFWDPPLSPEQLASQARDSPKLLSFL